MKASDDQMKRGAAVYARTCIACHQPTGMGLPPVFPPIANAPIVVGNPELPIKFILQGLMGPITVNGQHFDPTKGVPPMMGFGGLLNDEEAAAVLSYVRLSFGNNGKLVSPATVKKVREATKDRVNFYMADELLKEHPLKAAPPAKK